MDSTKVIADLLGIYPEMAWLTGKVDTTPEKALAGVGKTIGEQLFPHLEKTAVTELNRTAVGILALHWVLAGDYDSFTACQKLNGKLQPYSFEKLRTHTRSVLKTEEDIAAMVVFMVINDLTKIKSVVADIAARTGIADVDHDKMLFVGLTDHPEISPSFNRLSERHRRFILEGLATKFNIGQFIQAESVAASLSGLQGITEESLVFYLLHALYDIAGAAGHGMQNGSVIMNEPTYGNFEMAIASLSKLAEGSSVEVVYSDYMCKRAQVFGLDVNTSEDWAATRVMCMLREQDHSKTEQVLAVLRKQPKNVREILYHNLGVDGTNDGLAVLVYYAPAFLNNLQLYYAARGTDGAFEVALDRGLAVLARVFQQARIANKGKDNGVYTVLASALANAASVDPDKLRMQEIVLRPVGEDSVAELAEVVLVDIKQFVTVDNLADLPGEKIAVVGIGGGSDVVQAALLGGLLRQSDKQCACVISVRSGKTGSQSSAGKLGENRTVENHGGEAGPGVYRILTSTKGSGRFLENIPAEEFPTYLVIEREDTSLSDQVRLAITSSGGADVIIAVDTGGDALYGSGGQEETKATPDQDLRSLRALAKLDGFRKLSCEIAVGIDAPPNAQEVLSAAGACYYEPNAEQIQWLLAKYREWHMDGSDDKRYGKTPLAWQTALAGSEGFVCLDLPTSVVLDGRHPWDPFVRIQPSMRGMFFMDLDAHIAQIEMK